MLYGSGLLMNHPGSAGAPDPKICAFAAAEGPTFLLRTLNACLSVEAAQRAARPS